MSKLLKFLKPYAGAVLAILCVLIVQAYCDLSLPTYTSEIVNVGIQQGGIDETVPDTISEEDLDHLLLFVPSDKREAVESAYKEDAGDYDYDGKVMKLKSSVKKDEDKMDELSSLLGKPMLLASGFDSDSDMTKKMEEQMKQQMQSQMPDVSKMSVYDIFEMMEDGQRDSAVEEIEKQMKSMPDSMIEQAAATYIRSAYGRIGLDTDKIETD